MTLSPTEIVLFKEMIKDTVRSVIKEELDKIYDNSKKDLKEIKLLVAGMIKESRKQVRSGETLTEETKTGLSDILNRANKISRSKIASANPLVNNVVKNVDKLEAPNSIKNVLLETTMEMVNGGVSNPDDLGAGEYLTDDSYATGPVQQDPGLEYKEEYEEYESKLPDFTQALQNRFGK